MRRRRFLGLLGVAAGCCFAGVMPSRKPHGLDHFKHTMTADVWDKAPDFRTDVWDKVPRGIDYISMTKDQRRQILRVVAVNGSAVTIDRPLEPLPSANDRAIFRTVYGGLGYVDEG